MTKTANKDSHAYIRNHMDFDGSNFRGRMMNSPYMYGTWMSQADADAFLRDAEGGSIYAVLSYNTIIAWCGRNGWVVPKVRYTNTTSRHQHIVRVAVENYLD